MIRAKSNLITRVPLQGLCEEDFEKVKSIDSRYTQLLERCSEKSYHSLRKEIKPYIFTLEAEETFTALAKTKTEAIQLLKKQTPKPVITRIVVEYETFSKKLVVPKSRTITKKVQI